MSQEPEQPYQLANKKYVDEHSGTQLYKHKIRLSESEGEIYISAITKSSTMFTSLVDLAEALDEQCLISTLTIEEQNGVQGIIYIKCNFSIPNIAQSNARCHTAFDSSGDLQLALTSISDEGINYTFPTDNYDIIAL